MSKKGGYCLSLLKEAFSDPVKAVMNALDVDDSNPAPDPDDPSNPCNQNF